MAVVTVSSLDSILETLVWSWNRLKFSVVCFLLWLPITSLSHWIPTWHSKTQLQTVGPVMLFPWDPLLDFNTALAECGVNKWLEQLWYRGIHKVRAASAVILYTSMHLSNTYCPSKCLVGPNCCIIANTYQFIKRIKTNIIKKNILGNNLRND